MLWQDIVIALCTLAFAYALVPQVYSGFKNKTGTIKIQTSLITTLGLYITAVALFSLSLLFSGTMASITGTLWLILFVQKLIYR